MVLGCGITTRESRSVRVCIWTKSTSRRNVEAVDAPNNAESKEAGKITRLPRPEEVTEELEGTESWLSTETQLGFSKDEPDGST